MGLTKQIVDIINGNENDPSVNPASTTTVSAVDGGMMTSSILNNDNSSGANPSSRSSRPRRPRSQAASAGGREREFTGGPSSELANVQLNHVLTNGGRSDNNNEDTDALLRKLRNL